MRKIRLKFWFFKPTYELSYKISSWIILKINCLYIQAKYHFVHSGVRVGKDWNVENIFFKISLIGHIY